MRLPFCATRTNPKRAKIATTSAPDRRRSLGMLGDQLECSHDRRVGSQPECSEVLTFEEQLYGFAQIASDLVERGRLGNHRNLDAFGYVARLIAGPDHCIDGALQHPRIEIGRAHV